MKLNKKSFLAIFTALAIQAVFGVNFANAVPCENEILDSYTNEVSDGYRDNPYTYYGDSSKINQERYDMKSISKGDYIRLIAESAKATGEYGPPPVNTYKDNDFIHYKGNSCVERHNILYRLATSAGQPESNGRVYPVTGFKGDKLIQCVSKYMSQNNCDISAFLGGSSKQANSSSNQSSNSGSSSQSDNKANRQSANNQSSSNSNNQTNASSSSASSQNQSNPQGNSSNSDSNTGLSMKPEQEVLVNNATQKYASESAAFEASHKGLKRTHNKEDEASRCLVIENRKIKNTCDFRVEYTFCAYKPNLKAFSAAFEMAAAFDCEQRKFGSAGISAKRIDAGTYTAEVVYVFGCKDPSHPTGVTYERGRGLSGRCSE